MNCLSLDTQEAAAAKAARQAAPKTAPTQAIDPFATSVPINDAPPNIRHTLTKRTVQDEIQARCNVMIVTRGRFYPPGAIPEPNEPPIHLYIKPNQNAGPVSELRQHNVAFERALLYPRPGAAYLWHGSCYPSCRTTRLRSTWFALNA